MNIEDGVKVYDSISGQYDLIEAEPAFKVLRQASLRNLVSTFRQGMTIIDIGCGTGTEAIALSKKGVTVIGIDPSKGMIEQAQQKKSREGLSNLFFYQLATSDLSRLPAVSGVHRFDGGYSSLGSLNCEPNIEGVAQDLRDLLHVGSPIVVSVINKKCLTEMVAYALSRPSRVFRRSGPFMAMSIGGKEATVRVYSIKELKNAFKGFKPVSVKALSLLVPPPHLGRNLPEDIVQGLGVLDKAASNWWPLNRFGDFLEITFRR